MSDTARRIATSSQTVGPFFHFGLAADPGLGRIAAPDAAGIHIQLRIRVLDGEGVPVPDALIEVYQADADGDFPQQAGAGKHGFSGFGRLATNADGMCTFATIKPGAVRSGAVEQAPHVNVCFLSRGLLRQIYTRIYFEGDAGLTTDPRHRSARAPRHADGATVAGRGSHLGLRHPSSGRGRDGFLRSVSR
jgi:protocatechuate 3,4-dioxygenase alpha subunit